MKLAHLHALSEGGWSSTVTQSTKLTPANVKKALALLPEFEKALNAYLEVHGLPAVSITHPVGSTSYVDRDLKLNPNKEYGDVDVLVELQPILDMSDSRASAAYQQAFAHFIEHEAPEFVHRTRGSGQSAIFRIGNNEYVQVDLIKAFADASEWARYRTTPEYGVKGALIGFLYSALAEVLHLSIGQLGVQYKKKGGELVKFRTLKQDMVGTISRDFEQFGVHIAEWLVKHLNPKVERVAIHPSLRRRPGMRYQDVKVKDLADVVKGIALTLELNGVLGMGHLADYAAAEDLVREVQLVYLEKCIDAANSSKFDKAETEGARAKAAATKETLISKSKELAGYLDM
jgi:hypothetical protein